VSFIRFLVFFWWNDFFFCESALILFDKRKQINKINLGAKLKLLQQVFMEYISNLIIRAQLFQLNLSIKLKTNDSDRYVYRAGKKKMHREN
jgi:CRISPR/Cas system CSM-associated protein Csm5 (group 7 of RAMP superfamily)